MTLILPMWYIYGFYASTILKVLFLFVAWYRQKVCPITLKDIPGVVILVALDGLLSWLTVALMLRGAWRSEREYFKEKKLRKQMKLARG
jgi:hypothetical protein